LKDTLYYIGITEVVNSMNYCRLFYKVVCIPFLLFLQPI
jgi:hypothetical protein